MTTIKKFTARSNVYLTPELQRQLQDYANYMQTQQAQVIRQALVEFFERHPINPVNSAS